MASGSSRLRTATRSGCGAGTGGTGAPTRALRANCRSGWDALLRPGLDLSWRVADNALVPYSLILSAAVSMAAFVYGVGVGRYEWPPFRLIAELRASMSDALSPSQEARLNVF